MLDTPPVTLLLVEDDPCPAQLIECHLRRAHMTDDSITLRHGQVVCGAFPVCKQL